MNMTFVEAKWFAKRLKARLPDSEYRQFQQELLRNSELGDVMSGCGGLRKTRWGDVRRGKGKRGAFRIIYLWIPEANRIDLIDIYGKDEKQDLSANEKKDYAMVAGLLKQEAIAWHRRSKGKK